MLSNSKAFQVVQEDNVATALADIEQGVVFITGSEKNKSINAVESIPAGHKIALEDLTEGQQIIKYGVPIGFATKPILQGSWVHLHNVKSIYDERSSHLDHITGAPSNIQYE